MTLAQMVERQHEVTLEWCEPWPARDRQGNEFVANVALRATVHDCIGASRAYAESKGRPGGRADIDYLDDFIVTHWAYVVTT